VHEVLFPSLRNIQQDFENNFRGMTTEPVELPELLATRDRMMSQLQNGLDAGERRFLLSLVKNEPEWALLEIAHAERLPGIQWKMQNLEKLQKVNPKKFAEQSETLVRLIS
jgi:hypothetical protein